MWPQLDGEIWRVTKNSQSQDLTRIAQWNKGRCWRETLVEKKNDLLSSVYQLIQALYTILNSSSWWQQRHFRSLEFILSLIRLLGPSDRCFRSSLVFLFCFSSDNKSPFFQASRYIIFQIEKSQVALLFWKLSCLIVVLLFKDIPCLLFVGLI